MDKCEDCDAFQRRSPKNGVCRALPPAVLVFGMEQVNVPGLARGGSKGMRPITGTGFPEVVNEGWCRQFRAVAGSTQTPVFDISKLKTIGEAQAVNGQDNEGA